MEGGDDSSRRGSGWLGRLSASPLVGNARELVSNVTASAGQIARDALADALAEGSDGDLGPLARGHGRAGDAARAAQVEGATNELRAIDEQRQAAFEERQDAIGSVEHALLHGDGALHQSNMSNVTLREGTTRTRESLDSWDSLVVTGTPSGHTDALERIPLAAEPRVEGHADPPKLSFIVHEPEGESMGPSPRIEHDTMPLHHVSAPGGGLGEGGQGPTEATAHHSPPEADLQRLRTEMADMHAAAGGVRDGQGTQWSRDCRQQLSPLPEHREGSTPHHHPPPVELPSPASFSAVRLAATSAAVATPSSVSAADDALLHRIEELLAERQRLTTAAARERAELMSVCEARVVEAEAAAAAAVEKAQARAASAGQAVDQAAAQAAAEQLAEARRMGAEASADAAAAQAAAAEANARAAQAEALIEQLQAKAADAARVARAEVAEEAASQARAGEDREAELRAALERTRTELAAAREAAAGAEEAFRAAATAEAAEVEVRELYAAAEKRAADAQCQVDALTTQLAAATAASPNAEGDAGVEEEHARAQVAARASDKVRAEAAQAVEEAEAQRQAAEKAVEEARAEAEAQRQAAEKAVEEARAEAEAQRQAAEKAVEEARAEAEAQRQAAEKAVEEARAEASRLALAADEVHEGERATREATQAQAAELVAAAEERARAAEADALALRAQVESAQAATTDDARAADEARAALAQAQQVAAALEMDLSKAREAQREAQAELAAAQRTVQARDEELAQAREMATQAVTALASERERAPQQQQATMSPADAAPRGVSLGEVEDLRAALKAAQEEARVAQATAERAQREVAAMRAQAIEGEGALEASEAEAADAQARLEALTAQMDAMRQQVEGATAAAHAASQARDEALREAEAAVAETATLRGAAAEQARAVERLEHAVSGMQVDADAHAVAEAGAARVGTMALAAALSDAEGAAADLKASAASQVAAAEVARAAECTRADAAESAVRDMHEALASSKAVVAAGDQEGIDKRLVIQLLIRLRAAELGEGDERAGQQALCVLASMLGCSEAEKDALGLDARPRAAASWLSGLLGERTRGAAAERRAREAEAVEKGDKTIADAWVDYLLDQADQADKAPLTMPLPPGVVPQGGGPALSDDTLYHAAGASPAPGHQRHQGATQANVPAGAPVARAPGSPYSEALTQAAAMGAPLEGEGGRGARGLASPEGGIGARPASHTASMPGLHSGADDTDAIRDAPSVLPAHIPLGLADGSDALSAEVSSQVPSG